MTYQSSSAVQLAALLDLFARHTTRVRIGPRAAAHYGPVLITRLCTERGLTWDVPTTTQGATP